ncbi:MAG: hypothetical protein QME63_04265 [Actinomycetota bacterium]|nr:hypothetical protein [Actinomycetota bacterium]
MADKRIAIFQTEWPVQSQAVNLAIVFAKANYEVELYLYKTWEYVELESLRLYKNIRINNISKKGVSLLRQRTKALLRPTLPYIKQVYNRIRSFLQSIHAFFLLILKSEDGVLDDFPVKHALESMKGKEYRCLIGVEKKGLIWAGKVAKQLNIPFVYYSLELYTNDF